jgi:hypothetical protein
MKKRLKADKASKVTMANYNLNERLNEHDQQLEMGTSHLGFTYYLDDNKDDGGVEDDLKNHR